MKHRITIRAIKKEPPDLDRFVAALLAVAIARLEAGQAAKEPQSASEPKEGHE